MFITSFNQKDGENICWPTAVAPNTCNRSAVYLPQRGVDIKEEGPINVITSHLPKMSFIPTGKNKSTKQPLRMLKTVKNSRNVFLLMLFITTRVTAVYSIGNNALNSLENHGEYFSRSKRGPS